ncbi:hypothetical protein FOZ60_013446 [Perkinsus olseni]|uniref:Uncharacterized protein n=1 Tax=Perkinsus olseni TaxID=32597 RepID=A0A7J6N9B6_PEROL|nr:hypothetical protein FOZ60_013446 [Perkinsus olseni]
MEVSSDTTQADSTGSVEEAAGVLACRTEVWAPLLEGLAIDSTAVDIGQDFVDYLNEDGLDGGALPMPRRDSDDSDSDWEYDDSPRPDSYPASSTLAERFPVLNARVEEDYDRIVIDVYKRKDRYLVVDLGPWDEELTDSLLFTWEELQQQEGGDEVEWREVPRGSMPTNPECCPETSLPNAGRSCPAAAASWRRR